MEVVGGIVTALNLILSLVIGVRLLRRALKSSLGPELWLSGYFLFAAFLGWGLSALVYMSWADPALALPEAVLRPLNACYLLGWTLGTGSVYVFTWVTFRREQSWASTLVVVALATMTGAFAAVGFRNGFAVEVVGGTAYWIGWTVRTWAFMWLAIESLRYWLLLRRRLRLGLIEPVLTNRFLLWGVWSGAMFTMGHADPFARIWYVWATGTTTAWIPELAQPIVGVSLVVTATLGMLVATTLFLTFFPTPRYRTWVESRAAASSRS